MGWETCYIHEHCFSKKDLSSLEAVKEEIDELETLKKQYQDNILELVVITEPNKFFDTTEVDLLTILTDKINEYLKELISVSIELSILKDMERNWDLLHEQVNINGKEYSVAKELPLPSIYPCTFIRGDYVDTAETLKERIKEEENE